MKMYQVEIECTENPVVPKKFETLFVQNTRRGSNGHRVYLFRHENREYLVNALKYFGFQDASDLICEINENEEDQFIII